MKLKPRIKGNIVSGRACGSEAERQRRESDDGGEDRPSREEIVLG